VKLEEVAVAVLLAPAVTDTGTPTAVPPLAHPEALASGPQTEKLTVPVGLPPALLPVTVALSVSDPPSATDPLCGDELVVAAAWPTVKHSPLDPSLEAM
jgi:hypothetical protein